MYRKTPFISLLCLLLHAACVAQGTIKLEKLDYNEIISRAKQEKKPAMIYFTGTGCSLCIKMEKNVFPVAEVADLYNHSFINVESFDDSDKPDSATKRLRRQLGVVSNPTFIFIDPDGNIIHKSGYKTTEEFVITAKQALSSDDNYRSWTKQFAEGKFDAATITKYLTAEQKPMLYSADNYQCKAQEVLDKYFSSIPAKEYTTPANWNIINNYVANPYSAVFNYLANNQPLFDRLFGKEVVNKKIYDVYHTSWSGNKSSAAFKAAEKLVKTSSHPMAKLRVFFVDMDDAASKLSSDDRADWKDFFVKYDSAVLAYPYLVSPFVVYRVTESICKKNNADTTQVKTVNHWMQVISTQQGDGDADFFDLYARSFYLLGNNSEAAAQQQKALSIAIADKAEQKDLDQLKKNLALYQTK